MPTDPYPMPTAVQIRSATNLEKVKNALGIDTSFTEDDARLTRILEAVKRDVDKTLWNYFTDDDLPSGTPQDIPEDVELFIERRTCRLYEWSVEGQRKDSIQGQGSAELSAPDPVCDYEPILYLRDPLNLVGF